MKQMFVNAFTHITDRNGSLFVPVDMLNFVHSISKVVQFRIIVPSSHIFLPPGPRIIVASQNFVGSGIVCVFASFGPPQLCASAVCLGSVSVLDASGMLRTQIYHSRL